MLGCSCLMDVAGRRGPVACHGPLSFSVGSSTRERVMRLFCEMPEIIFPGSQKLRDLHGIPTRFARYFTMVNARRISIIQFHNNLFTILSGCH